MVPTPVVFQETPADTEHRELCEHSLFASARIGSPAATLPTPGQAGYAAARQITRETGNLLNDPCNFYKVSWKGMSVVRLNQCSRQRNTKHGRQ